eukprot:TRINITY_DN77114_c0_g1_i1.p1 TRINITY_DN77114_c0_g1~~TRINITY_DN77114_c0_g1_i1.p1  ORF type:complete len:653 (-),score=142.22 TRINITY_DN77114_c0_g1_i1:37-1995(-)
MCRHRGRRLVLVLVLGFSGSMLCRTFSLGAFASPFILPQTLPRSRAAGKRMPRRYSRAVSHLQASLRAQPSQLAGPCSFAAAGVTLVALAASKMASEEVEAAEDSAEEDDTEEDFEEEDFNFDYAGEGAEDILAAVKDAIEQQVDAVQILQERQLISDERSLVQALRALRLSGLHNEVLMLFAEFEDFTALPEAYAEKMSAARSTSQFAEVQEALAEMRSREVRPNIHCYNLVLRNYARYKSWKAATRLLSEMREDDISPDVGTFDNVLAALPTRSNWDVTLDILDQMKADGTPLNESCYHHAMHCLSYSPHVERCITLYTDMRENQISPSEDAIRYLLRSCFGEVEDTATDHGKAMQIFRSLEEDSSVNLTEVHFDMAISLCEKAEKWTDILKMAGSMGARGVTPHSVTCNAVLKACVEIGKWESALKLLRNLERDGTDLDQVAYSTVLAACARAQQWDEVLELYADVEKRSPEFVGPETALPAVTALCEVGKSDEAIALYRRVTSGRLEHKPRRSARGDAMIVDTRGCSFQVAGIMVRCALEDAAKRNKATASSATETNLKLAGLTPVGLEDILVAVHATDLDEDYSALPGSTAAHVVQVAQEMLGQGDGLECLLSPFACVKIPGEAQQALLVQRVQQAVSEAQGSSRSM